MEQIDESYFQGRRKYGKGRLRDGDKQTQEEAKKNAEMRTKEKLAEEYILGRVVGLWVFGLYSSPTRCRLYVVRDRSGDTLLPLVKENVIQDSTIVSDEWA